MKPTDWLSNDFSNRIPKHWKCPTCQYGALSILNSKFQLEETRESKNTKTRYSPVYADYVFSGILQCSNTSCHEVIAVNGVACDRDYEKQVGEHEYETVDYVSFTPRHFTPALHLFEIPKACPNDVKSEIIKAFGHFFNDSAACANRIRVAIERILNDQKVQKTVINKKGKRSPLNLHSRIDLFKKGDPNFIKIHARLLALKWIGNDGSHVGEELQQNDLLAAFELLEDVLESLYGDREERLSRIAKDVNKRKGIVSKRKRSE
jgi:hypothetical protein